MQVNNLHINNLQIKNIIKIFIAIILSSCTTAFAENTNGNGVNISINNTNTSTNIKKIRPKKPNLENFIPKPTDLAANANKSENKKEITLEATITLENIQAYLQKQDFFKKNYKPIIIASSILGSYSTCVYAIYCCKNYLEDKNLWSNWHDEINIEKLMLIPQDQLALEVFDEIKSKYENKDNFILSLSLFMKNIEKEKNALILFDKIYKFSKKYYITKLFPTFIIDTKCFENINEQLERLAYIKNVFLSCPYISYDNKACIGKKKVNL